MQESGSDPYSLYMYSLRSLVTRERYTARLRLFFSFIGIEGPIEERCRVFVERSKRQQMGNGEHRSFLPVPKRQSRQKGDKRQRYGFMDGIVYGRVNAPILNNYFGPEQIKLSENALDAIAMLADTVVQCVTKEWAKWRISTDKEELHGDVETEIERVKNKLEYEYSAQLHQMIASGYTTGAK